MADSTTVDSIEIEIEASSTEAEKKVNALVDALERLKKSTSGFGNVAQRIKYIGKSASESTAATKIRQKREALDRAAGASTAKGIDAAKISKQLRMIDSEIDKTIQKLDFMQDKLESLEMIRDIAPDTRGAAAEMKQLSSEIEKYSELLGGLYSQKRKLFSGDENAGSGSEPENQPEDEGLDGKISVLDRLKEALAETTSSTEKLKSVLGQDLSLQNLVPKGVSSALGSVGEAFGGLTDKALSFASAHPLVAAALAGVTVAVQTLWRGFKDFARSSFSAVKRGLDLVASGAKKLTSSLTALAKDGISKVASGLKSLAVAAGSRLTKPFGAATDAFNKLKNAVWRLVFMRTIRSAIRAVTAGFKEGVDDLYQYSKIVDTDFAPAMDKLATSALYLKNSLGAMAAPLIEAIAPAVDYLVDKFVELTNVIGKTFAALTGKDVYSQAVKYPVEYAEAAAEATKKTKEFKKFLLGIDELNIMQDQDNGTGDLKDKMKDYTSMFEEVEVPVEEFDWAKQIREAIENGEWYSVGRIVSDKLNEIVTGWDFYGWGKKLGDLINKGLNVAYGFLQGFNFLEFGSKIAAGINGLFDEVNWDLLGRTISEKWNALFNTVYGFATSLNWKRIGQSISEAINGFLEWIDATRAAQAVSSFVTGVFNMINTAIAGTNWALLGQKLSEFINNVDWYGAIYGGLSIITSGLTALKTSIDSFLKGWNWKDTATQIYTAINDAWSSVNWAGLGQTLGNMISTAFHFAVTFLSGINWLKIGQDIGGFLIGVDWVKAFGGLTETIAAGIKAAVSAVSGFLDTVVPNLQDIATGIAEKINGFFRNIDWAEAGRVLSEGIGAALDTMITFMQTVDWSMIGQRIADFLQAIDWASLLEKWGQLMGEVMSAKMELIDVSGILDVGGRIIEGLWNGMWAKFDASGGIVGWVKRGIFGSLLDAIKGFFGIHSPSTVMADIGQNLVAGLLNGLQNAWSSITNFLQNALQRIKDAVSGVIQTVTGVQTKTASSISDSASSWKNKLRSISAQNTLASAFSNVEFSTPKAYASGGFPARGEMFIAREAGPELVGKIGQKNTVANNEQITSGIADGVKDANVDVINAIYAGVSMLVKAVGDIDTNVSLDGEVLTRKMQPYQNRLATMHGTSLVD